MLDKTIEENFGSDARDFSIAVARLLGESETFEPVEQILPGRRQHPILRKMDVGVDKARKNEAVAMIVCRIAAKARRERCEWPSPENTAIVADDHRPFLIICDLALIGAEARRLSADDESHGSTLSSMRKRRIRRILAIAISNSLSGGL